MPRAPPHCTEPSRQTEARVLCPDRRVSSGSRTPLRPSVRSWIPSLLVTVPQSAHLQAAVRPWDDPWMGSQQRRQRYSWFTAHEGKTNPVAGSFSLFLSGGATTTTPVTTIHWLWGFFKSQALC
ncbi:hypothetical protein VULLAG_LOCUS19202 [Vulpes lagopus]